MKYLLQLIFVFTFLSNGIYSGEIKFPKFPKKAKSVKSFIPRGWKVHSKAVGDLNGDSLPDVALVLKYKNENRKKNSYRILLILLKEGKKYKIFAKSKKAIMKLSEGGKTGDPFIGLNIERELLNIEHGGGTNLKWGYTHKFKFKNKDFILISKKIIETHMNSLKSLDMKVNLISGRVLRKEVDRMGERKVKAYKEPPRPLIKIQEFTPYE